MVKQAIEMVDKLEGNFFLVFGGLLHSVQRLSREQGQQCLVNMLHKLVGN